jgi:hypothetical protein
MDLRLMTDNVFRPAKAAGWRPIRVKPLPDLLELSQQVRELLAPVLRGPDVDALLSGEGIRQMESSHSCSSLQRGERLKFYLQMKRAKGNSQSFTI